MLWLAVGLVVLALVVLGGGRTRRRRRRRYVLVEILEPVRQGPPPIGAVVLVVLVGIVVALGFALTRLLHAMDTLGQ